ncbi:peptide ligase PGM1-related protein [Streptomyces fildesensis]|uniref:Peptide ligase PGM1-related protein n=1 Tax=Streptomyces fildesensis TaxID=375757 RepID=A0ABW8CBY0_9ACTN
MLPPAHDQPLVILANFASDIAIDLQQSAILRQWSLQAPREIWLARPGDVLVTPVPLSPAFIRYACSLLDMPIDAISILTVPDVAGEAIADTVRSTRTLTSLRDLVAQRTGYRLLPTALDSATVALAADLDIPISPYDLGTRGASPDAVAVTALLNTKAGFRTAAQDLGMRLPAGRLCDGSRLPAVARELIGAYQEIVVKPDRSAGGHGLRFISGRDLPLAAESAAGQWVVEEFLADCRSVSAQFHTGEDEPRVLFSGEMSTRDGAFTGYRSPLPDVPERTVKELERWGLDLGDHLAARGYRGPYSIDAMVARHGRLYATEANVRRTATTTPHAMITRLLPSSPTPAWLMGTRRADRVHTFLEAVDLLAAAGLAYDPGTGAGVLLYADAPADGISWRYAITAPDPDRIPQLDRQFALLFAP